jgi:galactonate dehydratase
MTKAGLGIENDEEKIREAARNGYNWEYPICRNEDGSIAEWK